MSLDWPVILRDGALLSALASALVMVTLRVNPRLLMRHYPAELRAAVAAMTVQERGAGKLIGLALIALLIAGPWLSTSFAHGSSLPAGFAPAFLHAFAVSMVFNVVDWLILDELWLGVLRPRWAMLPGAEETPFRFNHFQHARGFLVGSVFSGLIAAFVAWQVTS